MIKYIVSILLLVLALGCSDMKEFEFPKSSARAVSTTQASLVTRNSARIHGRILTTNGKPISDWGIKYSTDTITLKSSTKFKAVFVSESKDIFYSDALNLKPSTRYFAQAYATNSYGTAYGEILNFTTLQAVTPSVVTSTIISNISQTGVLLAATVTDDGGHTVTRRGIAYSSTTVAPTLDNDYVDSGNGLGAYGVALTRLSPGVRYNARAYAINQMGIAYGQTVSFNTLDANAPQNITTSSVTNIEMTRAVASGSIGSDGGSPVVARGICFSNTNTSPTISNSIVQASTAGTGSFSVTMNELQPNTVYYIRAYGTNSKGTSYGSVLQFRTLAPSLPSGVTTFSVQNVTLSSATAGGNVLADGGAAITAKGLCYSSSNAMPSITNSTIKAVGAGLGQFTTTLTDLVPNTTYSLRAYATNSSGTSYGQVIQFKTLSPSLPSSLATYTLTNITTSSATGNGYVGEDGGSPITTRGFCVSSSSTAPSLTNNSTIIYAGSGKGSFSASINGLVQNTTYYVRSFATNSAGTSYGNLITFKTVQSLSVGQEHQGGRIGYIFKSGEAGYIAGEVHGLIVASSTVQRIWGCQSGTISTSNNLGTGNNNTINIVNSCSGSIAARYAYDLISGVYSDWYLPSYIDLQKIHSNNDILKLGNYMFWSSSQDPTNSQTAFAIHFGTNLYWNYYKSTLAYVLPVRSF